MANRKIVTQHSWDVESWPREVYPHTSGRARYVLRAHRDELIAEGVLARVGRELVVLGDRYTRWLEKRAANVPGFEIAPNKSGRRETATQADAVAA